MSLSSIGSRLTWVRVFIAHTASGVWRLSTTKNCAQPAIPLERKRPSLREIWRDVCGISERVRKKKRERVSDKFMFALLRGALRGDVGGHNYSNDRCSVRYNYVFVRLINVINFGERIIINLQSVLSRVQDRPFFLFVHSSFFYRDFILLRQKQLYSVGSLILR